MKTKRITAILLLAAMLLSACASQEEVKETETEAETAVTAETAAPEEETADNALNRTLRDSVGEIDFQGVDFRTMEQGEIGTNNELWTGEVTGDVLNDAVFERNKVIEDRFNIIIAEPKYSDWSTIGSEIRAVVRAGEDTYDLVVNQMEQSGQNAAEGNFRNLLELPHVDFSNPWYPKSMSEEGVATINGKVFMALSDLCYTYVAQSWAMVFDKVQAGNYGIKSSDVYESVFEGTWTIDKLIGWTENIYTDKNADGKRDNEDFYGLLYTTIGCGFAANLYGFGVRTVEVVDGEINMVFNSEHTLDVLTKISDMTKNTGTFRVISGEKDPRYMFAEGGGAFASMQLGHCYYNLRDVENPYGIIPLPKWDENQSEYLTVPDAGCDVITVLVTASKDELIGAMIEALSAESWRTVTPAFCDVVLGNKVARDPESSEIIEIVLGSRYIDFAYMYDGWNGWTFKLESFLDVGQFASLYKKNERPASRYYEKILKKFYE